jgi:hypothetical protein
MTFAEYLLSLPLLDFVAICVTVAVGAALLLCAPTSAPKRVEAARCFLIGGLVMVGYVVALALLLLIAG